METVILDGQPVWNVQNPYNSSLWNSTSIRAEVYGGLVNSFADIALNGSTFAADQMLCKAGHPDCYIRLQYEIVTIKSVC